MLNSQFFCTEFLQYPALTWAHFESKISTQVENPPSLSQAGSYLSLRSRFSGAATIFWLAADAYSVERRSRSSFERQEAINLSTFVPTSNFCAPLSPLLCQPATASQVLFGKSDPTFKNGTSHLPYKGAIGNGGCNLLASDLKNKGGWLS